MESPSTTFSCIDISGLTREQSLVKVRAEIDLLEGRLEVLKNLHNALIPTSTFPNEVLSEIFLSSHHADAAANFEHGHSRLTVSWVSHHWRSVAISCPNLWDQVVVHSPDHWMSPAKDKFEGYAEACIERSKDCDLAVSLLNPSATVYEMCLGQMHRLRDVWIRLDSARHFVDDHGRPPNPLRWRAPAPRLLSLYLHGFESNLVPSADEGVTLFSGEHPRLQDLTLASCSVVQWLDLPLALAPGLTTLHLVYPRPSCTIPADTILRILAANPTLVDCKIGTLIQPHPSSTAPAEVNLPNLTKLTIDSRKLGLFAFADRLRLPVASVHISATDELLL